MADVVQLMQNIGLNYRNLEKFKFCCCFSAFSMINIPFLVLALNLAPATCFPFCHLCSCM